MFNRSPTVPNQFGPEYPRCIEPHKLTLDHDQRSDGPSNVPYPIDPELYAPMSPNMQNSLHNGHPDMFSFLSPGAGTTTQAQDWGDAGRQAMWAGGYAHPYDNYNPPMFSNGWEGSPLPHEYPDFDGNLLAASPQPTFSRPDSLQNVQSPNNYNRNAAPILHDAYGFNVPQYAFRGPPEEDLSAPFGNPFPLAGQPHYYDGNTQLSMFPPAPMPLAFTHPHNAVHGSDEGYLVTDQFTTGPMKFEDLQPKHAQESRKQSRAQRISARPVTLEELEHDNSRFAKVVKAFLSIEDPGHRTVPEIASKVHKHYGYLYNNDFEGVKKMVNDVLQKHKAFSHTGRGTPYTMNLGEGRARREFPSSRKRFGKNENSPYYSAQSGNKTYNKFLSPRTRKMQMNSYAEYDNSRDRT